MTSLHQPKPWTAIIIRCNYPARAAPSSRVNSLNTNPRRSAGGSIQGNKTNYLVDNSASIQSGRRSPRPANSGGCCVIARLRLFFQIVPALKASGSLLPLLVHPCKKPSSGITKCFHSFAAFVFHVFKEQHGAVEWNEKVFPNPTRVLPRIR